MVCYVDLIWIWATIWFCQGCWANGSSERIKRLGERPQPWRVPQKIGKGQEWMPLVDTIAVGFVYKTRIILMKSFPSLNLSRTTHRYCHSSLSKAFSASSESMAHGVSSCCVSWIICISRWMLSAAVLIALNVNIKGISLTWKAQPR